MPTGVHLRDARELLFDAAERILLRDGAQALTSRAVTTEAGCAKGVLHRHFADFDAFLVELVQDRAARVEQQSAALLASVGTEAGTGTAGVVDTVAAALSEVFGTVALGIVGLITFRDDLRVRLRARRAGGVGLPVLTEAGEMLAAYLAAERAEGRLRPDADVETLALTLIGTGHLLFAGQKGAAVDPVEVRNVVGSILGPVVPK
jgi:AcrR family transcriptional regulator